MERTYTHLERPRKKQVGQNRQMGQCAGVTVYRRFLFENGYTYANWYDSDGIPNLIWDPEKALDTDFHQNA